VLALEYSSLRELKGLAFVGVGAIFADASTMSRARRERWRGVDVAGRVVFSLGFLLNLFYLNRL